MWRAWSVLPPQAPRPIVTLLKGCLEKDPRKRIREVGTALFTIDDAALMLAAGQGPAEAGHSARPHDVSSLQYVVSGFSRTWQRVATLTAGAAVVALAAGGAVWMAMRPASQSVVRTATPALGATAPDGRRRRTQVGVE